MELNHVSSNVILDTRQYLPQHFGVAPIGVAEHLAPRFEGIGAPDHMIERQAADTGYCPWGPHLERSMTPPAQASDLAQRQGLGAS